MKLGIALIPSQSHLPFACVEPRQTEVCRTFNDRPWNCGARFSRKAEVPSLLSSLAAQIAKRDDSSNTPSDWLVSKPWFTASSENLTASGALELICARIASER